MEMMTCVDLASSIASYDDSIIIVHTVPVSGTLLASHSHINISYLGKPSTIVNMFSLLIHAYFLF